MSSAHLNRRTKLEGDSATFPSWKFWQRQIVHQTTCYRTTLRFRLSALALLLVLLTATRGWWVSAVGWSLVNIAEIETPDLILIDNLDSNYLLFETAADLKKSRICKAVLVPVAASSQDPARPCLLQRELAELMIRMAHLDSVKLLPVKGGEPITQNVACEVADFLKGTDVRKVLILTSGFKSRRLFLIFNNVLSKAGIETYCLPVWGAYRPETWVQTWHGIQEVLLQHAKLAYYRLWVL